ncbi:hypothetical protein JY409_12830 [Stenotrophomonas maltophilia]|nr:hypothetical protein [Stenotrophomonas maltophilia]
MTCNHEWGGVVIPGPVNRIVIDQCENCGELRLPDASPPAQAVDLAMPIAMIDQALGHLSTALDDLDSSPDPRPGAMVNEAMACLRQALTGVPNG